MSGRSAHAWCIRGRLARPAAASLAFLLALAAAGGITARAEEKAGEGGGVKAYRAARIVTASGDDVRDGTLVVRDGRVEAVLAKDAPVPDGAEVVDLGAAVVWPGLVDPLSAITAGPSRGGRASQSNGSPRDGRKSVGHAGIDPKQSVYRRLGRTGYTSFAIAPNGAAGLIAGQASVIRPCKGGEKKGSELVRAESVYMLLGFQSGKSWYTAGSGTLRKVADGIVKAREAKKKAADEAKKKAEEEAKKKAEEAKKAPADKPSGGDAKPAPKPAEKTPAAKKPAEKKGPPDPLVAVFEGRKTVFLRVGSPASIDHAFAFLDSLPLRFDFVLVTRPQPADIVERLARRKGRIRGVVLEPRLATVRDTSIWVNTAREFLRHGVPVAFVPASDTIEGHREVFFALSEMVKSGVLEYEAIEAVTTAPARFLGLAGKVGSLEAGAHADFAVWNDDPLSGSARLLSVYVEGERVFADDPQTADLSGEAIR